MAVTAGKGRIGDELGIAPKRTPARKKKMRKLEVASRPKKLGLDILLLIVEKY